MVEQDFRRLGPRWQFRGMATSACCAAYDARSMEKLSQCERFTGACPLDGGSQVKTCWFLVDFTPIISAETLALVPSFIIGQGYYTSYHLIDSYSLCWSNLSVKTNCFDKMSSLVVNLKRIRSKSGDLAGAWHAEGAEGHR